MLPPPTPQEPMTTTLATATTQQATIMAITTTAATAATATTSNHSLSPHHETAFLHESMASPSSNAAAATKANSNTNAIHRLKAFLNKTLNNVSKTNVSDYTAQYFSSATGASPQLPSSRSTYDDIFIGSINNGGEGNGGFVGNITDGFGSYATAAAAADMAVTTLSNSGVAHLETTTTAAAAAAAFPTAQTVATFIAGNKNRATTIIVYPTVSPESIVIPIVSCIFGFPILAFIVICCLRHRAKLARERDRRRNYDMQDHAVSLVRFSPIHRLNYRSSRAISLRPERSLSQGFTSLELDTVVEERCSDVEQTQTEIIHPESPMESTTSYKMSLSSS
ncbi:uncharacterized protein LOC106093386 isoform X2 [Stomoxys calcitrans]|uniref:uncharacterized protein LOC106093386 isoform X2 n=1 Tax=Stomoxys calcitrans TaxID=35570 RepID=UPI0027E2B22D|nr:uncharacterized protein LOC106093386 isoform X2 [Stomoxys calcitrans]